jgi:methylenetetrahydrofolate reductase (NADPH)
MSSLASATKCLEAGLEPVLQLQARDRNRYAIEADVLGASALGVRNILCLSGDHLRLGPGPTPKPEQNDMDAIQVLWMLRRMRDEKRYLDGREIKTPPTYFLGAAANPYAAVPRYEAIREEKKVNAGAQFIQTQPIFDHGRFTEWLEAVDKRGLLDKVYILPGLIPLKSAKAAHMMAEEVPGVVVPPEIVKRMDAAADPKQEGVAIALELIEKLRGTPGIHGMHIMAVHWEEIVPTLIEQSGLPRPERQPAQAV